MKQKTRKRTTLGGREKEVDGKKNGDNEEETEKGEKEKEREGGGIMFLVKFSHHD